MVGQLKVPELLPKLNQEYNLNASSVKSQGSIWRVTSPRGIFVLKRVKSSAERLWELFKNIKDIQDAGFETLAPLIPSKSGAPFIAIEQGFYILSPFYEGENPEFTNPNHLQQIAKVFGKLHQVAGALSLKENSRGQDFLFEYQKRLTFLEELPVLITKTKKLNRIDRALLNWGEYFTNQARRSVTGLKKLAVSLNQPERCGFCHNDPAPRNIIIWRNRWMLIDLDLWDYNPFIREFANLTTRALQINQWDLRIPVLLERSYSEERNFTIEERLILPYFFCFPQRFWRVCSQRFQEKLPWTEKHFQKLIWEIINSEKKRFRFLKTLLPELSNISDPRLGETL